MLILIFFSDKIKDKIIKNEAHKQAVLHLTGDFVCDILKVILGKEEKYEKKRRCDFVYRCLCGDLKLGILLLFRCVVTRNARGD